MTNENTLNPFQQVHKKIQEVRDRARKEQEKDADFGRKDYATKNSQRNPEAPASPVLDYSAVLSFHFVCIHIALAVEHLRSVTCLLVTRVTSWCLPSFVLPTRNHSSLCHGSY